MAGNFVLTKDNVLMSPKVAARTGKSECTGSNDLVGDDWVCEWCYCVWREGDEKKPYCANGYSFCDSNCSDEYFAELEW